MRKYYDNYDDAEEYNYRKDPENRSALCVECGIVISASGENCIEFGIYMCRDCRNKDQSNF